MSTILITGGESGLGLAMVKSLSSAGHNVVPVDINSNHVGCCADVCSLDEMERLSGNLSFDIDILINNVGINKIDYLEDVEPEDFDLLMNTNAKSIYNCTKAFLPHLKRSKGTILNITSNAAHMPMTSSLAYNASKAAADMMTKQLARELFPRHGINVFGIAPNKLAGTGMSHYIDHRVPELRGWSYDEAREYQLKGLALGEETPPEVLARFVAHLLTSKDHHKWFHGCIIPFGL